MIKIIHVITGLGSGGAENMLYKLLKYSDKKRYYHEVVSLLDEGVYGKKIEELGIKVHSLNLTQKNSLRSLLAIKKRAKDFDIVNTWLYHADLFGYIVSKVLLKKKLIWNIRHSNLDRDVNKPRTMNIIKFNSMISKKIDCITYNSNEALRNHISAGYVDKQAKVIPNGFELDKFVFSKSDRKKIREKLGLEEKYPVFITVGRWEVQKDYFTLIRSLNDLREKEYEFKMLMVGTNLDELNTELLELIDNYNLKDKILLLGRKDNINELLSAADVYISSSLGESFSNSIGEAMACELQCIVTDVGESKLMVADTGIVVPAGDYRRLSNGLSYFLKQTSIVRNKEARIRIIDNYRIEEVVNMMEHNYDVILKRER